MDKRVVVTGMGVISPVGNDVNTFWSNLCGGACGIDFITAFPTENLPVKIAGIIKDFKAEEYGMDKPFIRKQDLFTQYGVAAAYQAMKQSGLCSQGEGKNIDPFRLGVYVGSGIILNPVQRVRQNDRGSFRTVDLSAVHPYDDLQHRRRPHRNHPSRRRSLR